MVRALGAFRSCAAKRPGPSRWASRPRRTSPAAASPAPPRAPAQRVLRAEYAALSRSRPFFTFSWSLRISSASPKEASALRIFAERSASRRSSSAIFPSICSASTASKPTPRRIPLWDSRKWDSTPLQSLAGLLQQLADLAPRFRLRLRRSRRRSTRTRPRTPPAPRPAPHHDRRRDQRRTRPPPKARVRPRRRFADARRSRSPPPRVYYFFSRLAPPPTSPPPRGAVAERRRLRLRLLGRRGVGFDLLLQARALLLGAQAETRARLRERRLLGLERLEALAQRQRLRLRGSAATPRSSSATASAAASRSPSSAPRVSSSARAPPRAPRTPRARRGAAARSAPRWHPRALRTGSRAAPPSASACDRAVLRGGSGRLGVPRSATAPRAPSRPSRRARARRPGLTASSATLPSARRARSASTSAASPSRRRRTFSDVSASASARANDGVVQTLGLLLHLPRLRADALQEITRVPQPAARRRKRPRRRTRRPAKTWGAEPGPCPDGGRARPRRRGGRRARLRVETSGKRMFACDFVVRACQRCR